MDMLLTLTELSENSLSKSQKEPHMQKSSENVDKQIGNYRQYHYVEIILSRVKFFFPMEYLQH